MGRAPFSTALFKDYRRALAATGRTIAAPEDWLSEEAGVDLQEWIVDANADGYPDEINRLLVLSAPDGTVPRDLVAALVDLAAWLGVSTHALTMPLVCAAGSQSADDNRPQHAVLQLGDLPAIPTAHAIPASQATADVLPSDCLTDLLTVRGALLDLDGDLLPDASRISFDLPQSMPTSLAAAVANVAGRIGLESGGVTLPLVRDGGAQFIVRPDAGAGRLLKVNNGWLATGDPHELAKLLDRMATDWPHITAPECGGVGQAVAVLRRWLAGDGPEPNEPGAILWERQWSGEWEVDRLAAAFNSLADTDIAAGTLHIFVSEPPDVRRALAARLTDVARTRGDGETRIVVLSAFKAGLSWLTDVVTPALLALPRRPAHIRISYRRMTEANTLDMPIRWLQELFPGPEMMATALGLAPEAIELVEVDAASSATFIAEALADNGASLGRWTCTPPARIQPFVAAFGEDAGRVVVTTGGIMAADGDAWREMARVPTDLETFWEFWQQDILPDLLRLVEESGAETDRQPFFGELLVEVSASEPNERLGVREENDSAAEALAEDIYFTTLDAIELFGQRTTGDTLSAPGPIIPIVRVVPAAAPSARITLRAAPPQPALPRPDLRVSEVTLVDGEFSVVIDADVDGDDAPTRDRLRALASMNQAAGPSLGADVRFANEMVPLRLPLVAPLLASDISDRPPMTENIHGDHVSEITAGLSDAPEITAWIEGSSYQGRPLPALALSVPSPGRLYSIVKAAIFKPTYLIVARHHANEISSTNAAFQLAWLCAHDPAWRRYLDAVNIVVLPYENPDGAALHTRLAGFPEAGTWKHHPARYNALGYEFGADHLDPDTRFGEARARGSLWRRWLPDAIVDNHGVPSHEWVQPFAGFGSPPRFRVSYWIVQALLYGIASYVDGPDNEDQRASVAALQNAVSTIVRDTDIGEWNRVYGASYREWGQSRLPDRFPGEFHDDMLWHIAAVGADSPRRGFHLRYPRTTVLSWVTEVNDETAEGEHLERVARAHLLANKATLDLLSAAAQPPQMRQAANADGTTTWQIGRQRPLRLGDSADSTATLVLDR